MNTKELARHANQAVRSASYPVYKLFFVHTAVAVGATLIVALVQFLLSGQIEASGGLGGMGLRSVLQTVRLLLSYVLTFVMPLWEVGALFAAIRISRGERAEPASLAEGLRRLWPLLRTMLVEFGVYMGAAVGVSYGLSLLYSFTPFATHTMEAMQPWMEGVNTQEELLALMQNPEFTEALLRDMWPVVLLSLLVSLGAMVFLFYLMRLMRYLVLDENLGAFRALKTSARLTAGHKWELAKLDLHFWWFYGLQAVTALILYMPELCAAAGIVLPLDAAGAYWLSYGVYALAQLALLSLARPQFEVAFAGAYDQLKAIQ